MGKRIKALLIFTTGITPVASAQAQLPDCGLEQNISDRVSYSARLISADNYLFSVEIQPSQISPKVRSNKRSGPEAGLLTLAYSGRVGSASVPDLEYITVKPVLSLMQPGTSVDYNLTVNYGGYSRSNSYRQNSDYGYGQITSIYGAPSVQELGTDITVKLDYVSGARPDGPEDLLLSYDVSGLREAFSHAPEAASTLAERKKAGECMVHSSAIPTFGCFLTTATCEAVGLADDCWELTTLRRFRDGWLAHQPGGQADIARYYREAPAIAERLKADRTALLSLYWKRIVPSALAAKLGANRLARRLYTGMMRELGTA